MADLQGQRVISPARVLDDRRLAALTARGDETAFEGLYDRHWRSLLAFCRHVLGDRQDAEDVLQQTFLRAHRALEAGRVPDSVRPWLFTIARNRCRTSWRLAGTRSWRPRISSRLVTVSRTTPGDAPIWTS